jgi:hypothetical protein
MKVSRKRSLRKNLKSRNKTRNRKIRKQYGGNLNSEQIQRIRNTLGPILTPEELTRHINLYNRVSTKFDPYFNEYFDSIDDLIKDDNYFELRENMEDYNIPEEEIIRVIQELKRNTFKEYNDMAIQRFKEITEDEEPETDSDI